MSIWTPCKQRIRRLMGTEEVKLTNERFMDKLAVKVREEYEHELAKREEELALGEIRRERELVLRGILDIPYQPRKRHPLTKQVMKVHQRQPRQKTKPRKSGHKTKRRTSSCDGPSKQRTAVEGGNLRGLQQASQSHSKTFRLTSTFGDVFQRLTSQWPVRPFSKEGSVPNDRTNSDGETLENKNTDQSKNMKKRRKRRKRSLGSCKTNKTNKLRRKFLRIRSVEPHLLKNEVDEDEENDETLVNQLKDDLFI